MYKVLIADDKPYERDYLRQFIEKHYSNDLKVVFEAADGEEVLRQIPVVKPDILLLDIIMPKLDGLETAEQIKMTGSNIFIVLISAHAEFTYAKKALKIGVNDYLLKPYLNDELKSTLDSVLLKVDKLYSKTEYLNHDIFHNTNLDNIVEKDVILCTIFDKKKTNLERLFSPLGISGGFFKCIVFYSPLIFSYTDKDFQVVRNIFQKKDLKVIGCTELSQLILIVFGNQYSDFNDIDSSIKRSREFIGEGKKDMVFCGSSSIAEDLSSIPDAYTDAADLIERFSMENVQKKYNKERNICFKIFEMQKQISLNIVNKKQEASMESVGQLYDLIKDYQEENGNIPELKPRLCQTIYFVLNNIDELLNHKDETDRKFQLLDEFKGLSSSRESVMQFWARLINELIIQIGKLTIYNNIPLVRRAKNYISEHYTEKISLQGIADELNISFGYLSKCFKQVEGIPLTAYLLNYRLEKAKELMRLQKNNISEVCFQVGFTDPNYFSKCFKNHTGLSPKEFCQKIILENL